jgi:integrase
MDARPATAAAGVFALATIAGAIATTQQSGVANADVCATANGQRVYTSLGAPGVTTHSFRKSLATLIDDKGLSARVGADQLGHTNVSMTQDKYMSRGRVHTQVADLLDRLIAEPDGQSHE